ncbi:DUF421 domain-containing protein [Thermoanaerobacterium thermosaccharolyticum]|uniref:DUF421 domain-containing protein n=1 Tax=Thermoanaerobacterium thermosaccharolyticum TaxID=1517 RepID=UPI003DA9B18F
MQKFWEAYGDLTLTSWVLRAVAAYLLLLLLIKIMGQRTLSMMKMSDFIISIAFGNIIAHQLSDSNLGLKGPVVTSMTFAALYLILNYLTLKYTRFRKLVDSDVIPLIYEGEIIKSGLRRSKIDLDLLMTELRLHNVLSIRDVHAAYLESNGEISIIKNVDNQNVTLKDLGIRKSPIHAPIAVIEEGTVLLKNLELIGKDEKWLKENLQAYNIKNFKDVFLAVYESNDLLYVTKK